MKIIALFKYPFKLIKSKNKMHKNETGKEAHSSFSIIQVRVQVKRGNTFVRPPQTKEGDLTTWRDLWKCCFQWSKASCLVLFTCFQWIMYLLWFMVRHAQPSSSPSMWNPTWIFHREPTGKTKIAQFKEVIKTVRNQYLSLEGPWWGFSDHPPTPSNPTSPCSSHWQLFSSFK